MNDIINIKKLIAALAMSCMMILAFAQQEAMNAQFILNTMVVNPAYTGYKMVQSITMDHRSQWVGFKGAPSTQSVGFDMSLAKNRELALGGNLMHDKIGPTSELSLSGNVAYRFRTSGKSYMSIGVKGYAGLFQAQYTSLKLTSEIFGQEDINFSYDPSNQFTYNFGIGGYFHADNFFVGLSSPRLLKTQVDNNDQEIYNTVRGRNEPTYYFMAGYSKAVSAWLEFQPAVLTKLTYGAPLSMAFYGSLIMKDKIRIGAFYGYKEVAGALVQIQMTERLRLGYSFDVATNELITTNLGSHEVSLTYDFKKFNKRIVYPRRF